VPSDRGGAPDAAQVLAMMKRAEGLAALGDLSGARLFWERLALQGHKEAALMLARSYDGAWLRGQGVVGVPADPVRAAYWYDRAGVGVGGQAKP
jgi:TPR repeat protein